MKARYAIISLLLLAATIDASLSTASREERERQIRLQLFGNVFVSPASPEPPRRTAAPVRNSPTVKGAAPQRLSTIPLPTSGNTGIGGTPGSGSSVAGGSGGGSRINVRSSRARASARREFRRLRRPEVLARTVRTVLDLQDKIIARGGCNRNLCFALDASSKLSEVDFVLQRDFVALIIATLGVDSDVHVSSWQYGPRVRRISRLSADINAFLLKLETWLQDSTSDFNFLAGAMRGCSNDLRRRTIDANKMIVIGNGRTSSFQQSAAVNAANTFRLRNGAVCAVAVSNANISFFTRLAGDSERVIGVTDFSLFDTILTDIVNEICGLESPI